MDTRPSVLVLGIMMDKLLTGNHLVHPLQKAPVAVFVFLGLVFGFREGSLINGGDESYAIYEACIILDFGV